MPTRPSAVASEWIPVIPAWLLVVWTTALACGIWKTSSANIREAWSKLDTYYPLSESFPQLRFGYLISLQCFHGTKVIRVF